MSELDKELKRLQDSGILKQIHSTGRGGKVSHKPNVPKTAKKWSISNVMDLRKEIFFEKLGELIYEYYRL